ncbi:hypothetical protein H257_17766 [Aphanomyces astaci]|uniref:Uncharacterized protein n=1 Tax=Aphanomyces astaci TaxID=112090 RepID=W4FDP0_APHAT|nr:hypothetical protein H257_17766 [Aphanomyces astaci]ETV65570.1 hypothetical protein H257_17766 [Aphanomyces astaci]|eukprot:XP_009844959.1 hypothetical protein H257_17766 [Aphanomyces astaci]
MAARPANQGSTESPQDRRKRLSIESVKQAALRSKETPVQHAIRLEKLKAKRGMDSIEEHAIRLQSVNSKRDKKTSEEHALRLQKMKARRDMEAPEEHIMRLQRLKRAIWKALHVSESVEERKSRLERRRQGLHRVEEAKSNDKIASEAQCAALDGAGLLHEYSKDMKSKILGELGFALWNGSMCVLCDMLQSMAARLRNPDATLCDELVAFYDCKDIHPAFVGLMLSRKGITHAGNVNNIENPKDVDFNVCLECETVLLQPWLSELPRHYVFPGERVDAERDIERDFDDDHPMTHADQDACQYDDPIDDTDGSSLDTLAASIALSMALDGGEHEVALQQCTLLEEPHSRTLPP